MTYKNQSDDDKERNKFEKNSDENRKFFEYYKSIKDDLKILSGKEYAQFIEQYYTVCKFITERCILYRAYYIKNANKKEISEKINLLDEEIKREKTKFYNLIKQSNLICEIRKNFLTEKNENPAENYYKKRNSKNLELICKN